MKSNWVLSKAHDLHGPVSTQNDNLVCSRCGIEAPLTEVNKTRCVPHWEGKESGWVDEWADDKSPLLEYKPNTGVTMLLGN